MAARCRACIRSAHGLGQSEVEDFHGAVARQHHVAGFQIPMNHASFMRRLQRVTDLLRDCQCFINRNRPLLDARLQRLAFDQLHDDALCIAGFFKAVDVRDVGMIQRRQHLRLAAKT